MKSQKAINAAYVNSANEIKRLDAEYKAVLASPNRQPEKLVEIHSELTKHEAIKAILEWIMF